MANFKQPIIAAGFTAPFVEISPDPIVAQRDPAPNDSAFDGQVWVNTATNTAWTAAGSDSLGTVWVISGSSAFTGLNLTINPGPTMINGDFTVLNTLGGAGAISLTTNGNSTETIVIENALGTAADAIGITALQGGVQIASDLAASADSVLISASNPSGGVTVDAGTGGITLTTTGAITLNPGTATVFDVATGNLTLEAATGDVIVQAGAASSSAIQLTTTDAAGGIAISTGTGGVTLTNTGDISLAAATASNVTVTGAAQDLTLSSVGGSVNVTASEAVADAIVLNASAGGIEATTALQLSLASTQNDPAAILISASAGGIDIQAQGAAGEDILIDNIAGSVGISGGEAVADALNFTAAAGGLDVDVALAMDLDSSQASATAITLHASNAAGGISLISGTGGIAAATTGASNITVTGAAADLTLSSVGGSVNVTASEAIADAIVLTASAGGLQASTALQLSLDSSQALATAINLHSSNAAGGITMTTGTGGLNLVNTGDISLAASTASNITVTGAAQDLTLASVGGSVNINASEAIADAIVINASAGGIEATSVTQLSLASSQASATAINLHSSNAAGGITSASGTGGFIVNTTGAVSLNAAANSNLTTTGAFSMTVQSTAGALILESGQASSTAVQITAANASGGIDMVALTGGITAATTGAMLLDAQAASHLTVTGAFQLLLKSTAGQVQLQSGANGGAGNDVNITASNAAGGVSIGGGTGGLTMGSTGFSQLGSTLASQADAITIASLGATSGILLQTAPTPGITISNGTQTAQILVGTGSPNTVVTAVQGSLFIRTDGAAATTLYVNTNGITAWTALTY